MSDYRDSSRHLPLEEMDFFRDLEQLSDEVWKQVYKWKPFERDSIGLQLVRAMDSIGANIAEGGGRVSGRETLHFFAISKGSARESRFWLRRARERELMTDETADDYLDRLESVVRRLNSVISYRRQNPPQVRESEVDSFYDSNGLNGFKDALSQEE